MYQNKLQEQGAQDVVNIDKIKFEPHGDLVDRAYLRFNETLINNQDQHSQIENGETPVAEYPNENDSEDTETNKMSTIPIFMPQILPDGEIAKSVNSLNSKQREVFNVVHKWAKDYVKCNGHNFEPVYIFLSGIGGTGKSHLVKVIYNAISKTLLYHCKDPEKPRVLLHGPTGISAVNIGGTTIHSGLGIKPGIKLLGLNDKFKAALSEVKFLIIDELSMVSSNLWIDINSRLEEIFVIIPEKAFAGLSVMTVGDFLQLPPVSYLQSMERNEAVLNYLPGELYTVEADDTVPDKFKYPLAMIEAAQNQKQTNTGGLAKLLKLKIGAKVMFTVNVDIQDRLING